MTMSLDQMIEVLQAAKDKKQIDRQRRFLSDGDRGEWENNSGRSYDFSTYTYRIAPEPRELWANLYDNDCLGSIRETKESAIRHREEAGWVRLIHFREVTE